MAQPIVMTSAQIRLFVNNQQYKEVQSISFDIDYGEAEIFGIDAAYPQEIATTKISVKGTVQGIRVKNSGGLQAKNMRSLFNDILAAPYISIRIQDRSTGEDILFIPNAKVTREQHTMAAKQKYGLTWSFSGQLPLMALDRSDPT